MRCLLKVRATLERVKEIFHSPRVESFKRTSYYFPPAHSDPCYSPFLLLFWLLSGFTRLHTGWSGAYHCTYIYIHVHIMWLNSVICRCMNCMYRNEKEHSLKPCALALGLKTTEKPETYFHCGPPCMWACMCVCGCWMWSVRQGWKDYRSGNNFTVCMGNCCDLFRRTVQISSREGDGTGMNERVMTTKGAVIRKGLKMLEQKLNRRKKNVFIELDYLAPPSRTPALFPSAEAVPSSDTLWKLLCSVAFWTQWTRPCRTSRILI